MIRQTEEPMPGPQAQDGKVKDAKLARMRVSVGAVMIFERLWPLVVPPLIIVSTFISLSWFGLFWRLSDWPRIGIGLTLAAVFLAALWPLRKFSRPTREEIERRIERANALKHRPIATQTDRIAGVAAKDGFAQALWAEHQRRLREGVDSLHGDLPSTKMAERDPYGIRAGALLVLVIAFAFSYGPNAGSLTDVFRYSGGPANVERRIDAWVTPPGYTGRPVIYLTAQANREKTEFSVPAGSMLSVQVGGGTGAERLAISPDSGETVEIENEMSQSGTTNTASRGARFNTPVAHDSAAQLSSGMRGLQSWSFKVIPDKAPTIAFDGEPHRARNGTLEIPYIVKDDYGAVKGHVQFDLAEPVDGARPLFEAPELALGVPRRGEEKARVRKDLTEHVWAGADVNIVLSVSDGAEQEGLTQPLRITMPQRPFSNPLARAVLEQRRLLGMDANARHRVLTLMDAMMLRPDDTINNTQNFLLLASARARLSQAHSDDALRDVVAYLWSIANQIESGSMSDAQQRLSQAQQALREALQNGASDEEISQLMQELRQAMNEFMQELARQAMQNPNSQQQASPDAQMLSQRDLERMLDQMENLAKSGARDQAEQMLSQLENMLNNRQAGQPQQGQGGEQNAMRQSMDELGRLLREQQQLMDETHRQGQQGPGQQGQDQQGQGEQGEGQQPGQGEGEAREGQQPGQGSGYGDLQSRQNGIQRGLSELTEKLRQQGIEPGEGFGEADGAMGQAGEALGQEQSERAVGEQGRAMEAMRRGAQDMMQQMQQAQQGQDGPSGQAGNRNPSDRDPLGRPRATTGPQFDSGVEIPDEIDVQQARRILEEIRKRLGDALSPQLEREYLERLLRME
ncbi:TIGR02302 family protein [Limoniibacter endophyticus]|uniref:TIGR02302 family protein n=1 Tax=Limoniibacter endophyticus TaxID=1565040 RepID=A0A8J3DQ51_9HYPH|nr:TIGR02302 family protein [Limoniibacter endophyticus]GHC72933.1 TIGR02302 family protein [Limoniibacter endophyticus]